MKETMEKMKYMNILKWELKFSIKKLQILLIYHIVNITILLYVLKNIYFIMIIKLLEWLWLNY